MFQIVLSGPIAGAQPLVDALSAVGFPCQIDDTRGGFPVEVDVEWVEAVASTPGFLEDALQVGRRFGFQLRLHSWIEQPVDPKTGRPV